MRSTLYAALFLAVPFSPAAAHAILVDSQPGLHGAIPAGVARIVLRFNSRIDADRSRLALLRPDRAEERLPIAPGAPASVLATSVPLAPGEYTVRWQVLALDGHITRGNLPFTVHPERTAQGK